MEFATKENIEIGDTVLIPINNEYMSDEQIMLEYEVVLALKAKVTPERQITGLNQEPLRDLYLFREEMAYKI